jgi:hypothetical protein
MAAKKAIPGREAREACLDSAGRTAEAGAKEEVPARARAAMGRDGVNINPTP